MLLFVLALRFLGCLASSDNVAVQTRLGTINGLKIETSFLGRTGKVATYRGIPYAEAPVGDRRFRKPVPRARLPDPFNATDYSPACPQDLFMMMGWVPGYPYVGDDCLTLNVFVPENNTSSTGNRAVLVWIHGGAYVIGQSKMYNAENLTLVGDIIVVTINYRVTSLGFLATGSNKYPGNAGLWDQHLAIQWVHDNIADFGGNPSQVTIAGESAGASSVLHHALYPGNKGLFKRIIAESGSPLCPWAYQPDPVKYARRLTTKLGCTDPNLDAAVDCIQGLDAMVIVNASRVGTMDETVFRAEWDPVLDGEFITRAPGDMFTSGTDMFRELEYLVGMNNNDGAFVAVLAFQQYLKKQLNQSFDGGIPKTFFDDVYIPMFLKDKYGATNDLLKDYVSHLYTDWSDPKNETYVRSKFLELSGDYNFFMPILATLEAHAKKPARANAFLYEFDLRPKFSRAPDWLVGANHGEELPFVFGFPSLMAHGMGFEHNVSEYEKHVSHNMMIRWSNFVKSGNPNSPVVVPDSVPWPRYEADSQHYLQITASGMSRPESRLLGGRADFWLHLAPRIRHLEGQQATLG